MTKPKKDEASPKLPEQFFYDVRMLDGTRHQVTADSQRQDRFRYISSGRTGELGDEDAWLIFSNRGVEVFRYRVSLLAGWSRNAKPGVTA